jgi:hypothetical protein
MELRFASGGTEKLQPREIRRNLVALINKAKTEPLSEEDRTDLADLLGKTYGLVAALADVDAAKSANGVVDEKSPTVVAYRLGQLRVRMEDSRANGSTKEALRDLTDASNRLLEMRDGCNYLFHGISVQIKTLSDSVGHRGEVLEMADGNSGEFTAINSRPLQKEDFSRFIAELIKFVGQFDETAKRGTDFIEKLKRWFEKNFAAQAPAPAAEESISEEDEQAETEMDDEFINHSDLNGEFAVTLEDYDEDSENPVSARKPYTKLIGEYGKDEDEDGLL